MRPIAIDGGEAKKKLCLSMGAEAFIDFRETKDVPAEVVKIADGIGAHGVLVSAYQAYKGRQNLQPLPYVGRERCYELTNFPT